MAFLNEDPTGHATRIRKLPDFRDVVAGHAARHADRNSSCRACRNTAALGTGCFGNDAPCSSLKLIQSLSHSAVFIKLIGLMRLFLGFAIRAVFHIIKMQIAPYPIYP